MKRCKPGDIVNLLAGRDGQQGSEFARILREDHDRDWEIVRLNGPYKGLHGHFREDEIELVEDPLTLEIIKANEI